MVHNGTEKTEELFQETSACPVSIETVAEWGRGNLEYARPDLNIGSA
jgi:hypothetical protein